MPVNLMEIREIEANGANFTRAARSLSNIKYIVLHYTGNKGDTALNNCRYFRDNVVESSAHYFVDAGEILCSVPITHAAWAVGLGSRKQPYSIQSHWKKANNSNTVSIEMCGGKGTYEADEAAKENACQLAAALLTYLKLTPDAVIRHYDVTGKQCPAWAVTDKNKWLAMQTRIAQIYNAGERNDDIMLNTEENYQIFKEFAARLESERASAAETWETPDIDWAQAKGIMSERRAKSYITRGETAAMLRRLTEKTEG